MAKEPRFVDVEIEELAQLFRENTTFHFIIEGTLDSGAGWELDELQAVIDHIRDTIQEQGGVEKFNIRKG